MDSITRQYLRLQLMPICFLWWLRHVSTLLLQSLSATSYPLHLYSLFSWDRLVSTLYQTGLSLQGKQKNIITMFYSYTVKFTRDRIKLDVRDRNILQFDGCYCPRHLRRTEGKCSGYWLINIWKSTPYYKLLNVVWNIISTLILFCGDMFNVITRDHAWCLSM